MKILAAEILWGDLLSYRETTSYIKKGVFWLFSNTRGRVAFSPVPYKSFKDEDEFWGIRGRKFHHVSVENADRWYQESQLFDVRGDCSHLDRTKELILRNGGVNFVFDSVEWIESLGEWGAHTVGLSPLYGSPEKGWNEWKLVDWPLFKIGETIEYEGYNYAVSRVSRQDLKLNKDGDGYHTDRGAWKYYLRRVPRELDGDIDEIEEGELVKHAIRRPEVGKTMDIKDWVTY